MVKNQHKKLLKIKIMHKKLVSLILSSAFTIVGISQKATKENPFSIEGQLSLNSTSTTFNAPSVRLRYFVTDGLAARVSFLFSNVTEKNYYYELPNNGGGVGNEVDKTLDSRLSLGAEKHFMGTERLSPYIGSDISFSIGNKSSKWENFDGNGYISGVTALGKNPTNSFGFNIVTGTDYYFAKNIYFGFELGFGIIFKSVKAGSLEYSYNGTTTKTLTEPSSSNEFGNNVLGNFRVGWRI
jgi:hypothetical protein